tara:strand:+ start:266 stop:442 length:177 start_codon:yes stop_codon:yes gene_type:complete
MYALSEVSTPELKRLRKYLLIMYAESDIDSPRHARYGIEADNMGRELNRRTGESKYKL